MGTWRVTADLLAESRFVLSPLAETAAALTVLDHPDGPWQAAFHATNRAAYDDMLAAHPVRRAIAARCWWPSSGIRQGWMASFLAVPPIGDRATFAEELESLGRAHDDDSVRSALLEGDPAPLDPLLAGDGVRDATLGLLQWIWSSTVEADWPRRERVLRADIVARTATLATRGWAGVLPTLGARRVWLGDGRLQINHSDTPDRDLTTARSLYFVPVHVSGRWACWDERSSSPTYALVYPVTGALAPVGAERHGLVRLVGANRAALLGLLDDPSSTTALTAVSGLPLGSVGNHLKVLLDAGVVLRRRSGREVLYWRTALGDSLVATDRAPAPVRPSFRGR